jgi:hypothetical protein
VATIRVYNLNAHHEAMIDREFNDVILQGGYQGNTRLFFRGNIKFVSFFREGVDRICELNVGDGDKDFRGALVNFSLAAGHDDAETVRQLLTPMQATTPGHIHGKNLKTKHSRGRVFSGNARDFFDRIADHNDADWSIQDGKFTLVPVDSTLPNEAIAVSSDTGLLGAPEKSDKGIVVKVMFDPRIIPASKLWLFNNEVKMKKLKAALSAGKKKRPGDGQRLRLDPDGIYKVYAVHGQGDTRGTEWTAECKCVALDAPIPSIKGMPISSTTDAEMLL